MAGPRPDGLGLQAVSDFAGIFTASDYEARVQTATLDKVAASKDGVAALARLRVAWRLAASEVGKACQGRVTGSPNG